MLLRPGVLLTEALALSPAPPTVLFGFNRPVKLRQVLEALRPQGPERLIAVIDGPRDDGDLPGVEACRRLVREVDWVETEEVFHERNRGCTGVPRDIDRIFEEHEAVIFLEDDCLPMPSFHEFMRQGLARYAEEPRIFSLCGYQILPRRYFRGYLHTAVGTSQFRCWGWGSWRDRWREARRRFPDFGRLFNGLQEIPETEDPSLPTLAREAAAGRVDYWDIMLSAIGLDAGWLNLLPTRGLVRNTGVGAEGAHRVVSPPLIHNRNVSRGRLEHFEWPSAGDEFQSYRHDLGAYLRRAQTYRGRYRALLRRLGRLSAVFTDSR